MATTADKIEKALSILKHHDWYWSMADYSSPAYGNAYGSMRAFVEVVSSISDSTIVKALRELWKATYYYIHATMWSSSVEAKETFKTKESELIAVIKPTYSIAA